MNKPHWQKQHEGWEEDFLFYKWQRWFFLGFVIKHPTDKRYPETATLLDKLIAAEQKKFKQIYGVKFPIDKI